MNRFIDSYNLILEHEDNALKVYALEQLQSLNHLVAFQKVQLLYTCNNKNVLDHLYRYTCLFSDEIKNTLILEHLDKQQEFSEDFCKLLSSFNWDKPLLKKILILIDKADHKTQAKLLLLLGQYRFLLPDHFIKRYLFSKSSDVSVSTFNMLSKTPLAQDEQVFKENLKHPNLSVVASCYAGLWKLGNTTLLLAFTSDHQTVIESALLASKEVFADERLLNHLLRYLKSDEEKLALLALNACTHRNCIEPLVDLIVESQISFVDKALTTCLNLAPERSINHLLNYIDIYESSEQNTEHIIYLLDQVHIWSRNQRFVTLSQPILKQINRYSKQASDVQVYKSRRNRFTHYFLTPKYVNDETWPTPLFES